MPCYIHAMVGCRVNNEGAYEGEVSMKKKGIVEVLFVAAVSMGLVVYIQSKIVKQTKVERAIEDRRNRYRANYVMFLELKRNYEDFDANVQSLPDRRVALAEAEDLSKAAQFFIEENRRGRVLPTLTNADLILLREIAEIYQDLYEDYLEGAEQSALLSFILLDPENNKLSPELLHEKILESHIDFYERFMDKEFVYEELIPLTLGTIDLLKTHALLYNTYKNNIVFTHWEAWLKEMLKMNQ